MFDPSILLQTLLGSKLKSDYTERYRDPNQRGDCGSALDIGATTPTKLRHTVARQIRIGGWEKAWTSSSGVVRTAFLPSRVQDHLEKMQDRINLGPAGPPSLAKSAARKHGHSPILVSAERRPGNLQNLGLLMGQFRSSR